MQRGLGRLCFQLWGYFVVIVSFVPDSEQPNKLAVLPTFREE